MTAAIPRDSISGNYLSSASQCGANGRTCAVLPRLLVSVRSPEETTAALQGGAEILDIKNPSQGSLGMASLQDITAIAKDSLRSQYPWVALSVALGELADWNHNEIPSLPEGVQFAKLGLSQCASRRDWVTEWSRIRSAFAIAAISKIAWVAVVYADAVEADAPPVGEVLEAAIETGCAGLLIDTWAKDQRTLLNEFSQQQLVEIAERCRSAGLFLALAGRLNADLLPALSGVPADILAIRSAACRGSDRTAELDSTKVSEFRHQLRQAYLARL
ncbi:(5-formylfuran-3-yl)methyl phosphate synthase [Schlesneria sp. T3-172]|uniref:(5-formylfuran-3-yl)methyl phosphate synthase n=1 Tax=Schlesneria sphaerica TaxID=3373610 RepID=UPI0037C9E782